MEFVRIHTEAQESITRMSLKEVNMLKRRKFTQQWLGRKISVLIYHILQILLNQVTLESDMIFTVLLICAIYLTHLELECISAGGITMLTYIVTHFSYLRPQNSVSQKDEGGVGYFPFPRI